MCGSKRRAAPINGYDYARGCGYSSGRAQCGHRAGCSRRRCAEYNHCYTAASLGAREGQVSGVTYHDAIAPPQYPAEIQTSNYTEKGAGAKLENLEEPPKYTPHAEPMTPALNRHAEDTHPISSKVDSVNANFSALPILQSHTHQSIIDQDLTNLNNSIASLKLREHGSKHACKRAAKQLARDLLAAEQMKWAQNRMDTGCGGRMRMNGGEKRMVKAQVRGLKDMVRQEIREVRR